MPPTSPRPKASAASAGERTVARANPRKVETCKVPVVYDPRVSGSLVGHLVGAINGASIARKTSFLKDRLGEQLFAKNIRIIDDPLRVRGLRSQTFDAEGVKVKKLAHHRRGRADLVAAGFARPRANSAWSRPGMPIAASRRRRRRDRIICISKRARRRRRN